MGPLQRPLLSAICLCPHPPQIPLRRLPAAKSLRIRQNLLQRLSPGPALSPLALTASVSIGLV
jgi:hypothetical protein